MPDNDPFTLSLLTNKDMIRVNQHSVNNHEVRFVDGISVWSAEDKTENIIYVAFLNTNDKAIKTQLPLSAIGKKGKVKLKDIWKQSDKEIQDVIDVTIPEHGGLLFSIQ